MLFDGHESAGATAQPLGVQIATGFAIPEEGGTQKRRGVRCWIAIAPFSRAPGIRRSVPATERNSASRAT